jgi:hypothetical protein
VLLRRRQSAPLLDFDEVRRRLRLGTRVDEGLSTIPVTSIIGSVARTREFDAAFRPRTRRLRSTIRQIAAARDPNGPEVPISVYRVDHAYFVLDGHKRLSLAVAEGREHIDAEVSHWASQYHVPPSVQLDEIRLTEEEERFREETGLARVASEVRFPLSDSADYLDLVDSVNAHGFRVSRQQGRLLTPEEAARHWLEHIYQPSLKAIAQLGCHALLPSFTDADLFLTARRGNLQAFDVEWRLLDRGVKHAAQNLGEAVRGTRAGLRRSRPRRPQVLSRDEPEAT